jgi:hypothetical protein
MATGDSRAKLARNGNGSVCYAAYVMTISLLEPVLRLRPPAGVSLASLSEIMSRCVDRSLVDLPGMRMDQRAPACARVVRDRCLVSARGLGDQGFAPPGGARRSARARAGCVEKMHPCEHLKSQRPI